MLSLIDTHCHLDQVADTRLAIEEAKKSGVDAIIAVGVDNKSNIRNLQLAKEISIIKIFVALGLHPTEIKTEEIEESLKFIRENIKPAVAIGEIGLDFWHKKVKKDLKAKEEQKEVFQSQLKLAKEFNLPVVIHSRGAWKDCLELTLAQGIKKAVFHWYSGPIEVLQEIIKEGYLISATPALGYSEQHSLAIKSAPLDNILIETDTPVFYQNSDGGFMAGPKDVVRTLNLLAQLKQKPETEIKEITTKNALKLFNLEKNG
jgi:TatD DNase family protein